MSDEYLKGIQAKANAMSEPPSRLRGTIIEAGMSEAREAIIEGLYQEGFFKGGRTPIIANAILAALDAAGLVVVPKELPEETELTGALWTGNIKIMWRKMVELYEIKKMEKSL